MKYSIAHEYVHPEQVFVKLILNSSFFFFPKPKIPTFNKKKTDIIRYTITKRNLKENKIYNIKEFKVKFIMKSDTKAKFSI